MTIAFRQSKARSETDSSSLGVVLDNVPLNGSALIAAVAVASNNGVIQIVQTGASWALLFESASSENADEANGSLVRAQIWGAFDIEAAVAFLRIPFTGGTTKRGVIVAEYTGGVFEFPNPADRVVGDTGTTAGPSVGSLDTGIGGVTREAAELWVGAGAVDKKLAFSSPGSPFAIRDQVDIGSPAAGKIVLVDAFLAVATNIRFRIDHASGSSVAWAATMAAIRGNLQVPAEAVDVPAANEPVTEFEDYSTDGIEKLAAQYRARS